VNKVWRFYVRSAVSLTTVNEPIPFQAFIDAERESFAFMVGMSDPSSTVKEQIIEGLFAELNSTMGANRVIARTQFYVMFVQEGNDDKS